MFPLSLHNYFELLALACSIIFWKCISNTPLKWFVPFLIFIVTVELTGRYIRTELKEMNAWLYNFTVPVEFLFYSFIFFMHYHKKRNRTLVKIFSALFVFYTLAWLAFNGTEFFNSNMLLIGYLFMIIFSILFLVELYNKPGMVYLTREPLFWIAVGLLLFSAGGLSYALLTRFALLNKLDQGSSIFRSINQYLNLLLYLCISISFLCRKDLKTSRQTL